MLEELGRNREWCDRHIKLRWNSKTFLPFIIKKKLSVDLDLRAKLSQQLHVGRNNDQIFHLAFVFLAGPINLRKVIATRPEGPDNPTLKFTTRPKVESLPVRAWPGEANF